MHFPASQRPCDCLTLINLREKKKTSCAGHQVCVYIGSYNPPRIPKWEMLTSLFNSRDTDASWKSSNLPTSHNYNQQVINSYLNLGLSDSEAHTISTLPLLKAVGADQAKH
jgi:hypothetical protein